MWIVLFLMGGALLVLLVGVILALRNPLGFVGWVLWLHSLIAEELARVASPDGKCVAVLLHKASPGPALPGPEPPKTLKRWARLKVLRGGTTVYDSGFENLNVYQYEAHHAMDVAWSPDSKHLAYRHITSLRVIDEFGEATAYPLGPQEAVIASFRWIDAERLLIVSKTAVISPNMLDGPALYWGSANEAKTISIARLHLSKGTTERFQQALAEPRFLFHGVHFCLDEISPQADRVAFSDGANLCIYDDAAAKLIAQVEIPQKPTPEPEPIPDNVPPDVAKAMADLASQPAQLEGIWWPTNDKLLIGVGLLGSSAKAFYTFDIPSGALTDETEQLLPIWEGNATTRDYQDPDWYRSVLQ